VNGDLDGIAPGDFWSVASAAPLSATLASLSG